MLRALTILPALALLAAAPLLAHSDSPAPLSEKAQKALAGRTAGKPVNCVQLNRIGSSTIVDETAIIYKQSSSLWYVNQPDQGSCNLLRPRRTLMTRTSSSQLCGNDLVSVADLSSGITYGACGLGKFVAYRK